MRRIWEFYENLNEIVYVMEMGSYELVYMNGRARTVYGLKEKEYRGMKCYEVLQGCSAPCAACNNANLQSGRFLEWYQYHPKLEKLFDRKCTLLEEDGKRYRFEMAIDRGDMKWQSESKLELVGREAMINEILRVSLQADTPEKSIAVLLEYLGQFLHSDRVYIFEEKEGERLSNTYEWCAKGICRQMDWLRDIPLQISEQWYRKFHRRENVVIQDMEEICQTDPEIYKYLQPQNISSLVVSPLVMENKIIGFYGADNPPEEMLENISTVFQIMGHFIVSLLKRRNLVKSLEQISYHDQLTEIGNRHAMNEYIASLDPESSIGILYCDVMGLKRVNDTKGHKAGDCLLRRASQCLQQELQEFALFRVGGDEFLALCTQVEEPELLTRMKALRDSAKQQDARMAVGCVWRPNIHEDMNKLIAVADHLMYEDKKHYYEKRQHKKKPEVRKQHSLEERCTREDVRKQHSLEERCTREDVRMEKNQRGDTTEEIVEWRKPEKSYG